ncbi:MAG: hypothetical protein COV31_02555 [Candidatus Yanofskybacteria bacterium CG10_big_fil_rev_8_21_14_0_10_46_23]|uniref:Type II secretion system protein GspG C-terminal domain-containing protein n=1 Tax=Candidatus Yanofskybacteria bacterium CG10_big_fil_rev_8_21_14_0_10_46_23 TaxID=1975098 RepID=A0A2H0R411_9BACT|nr:MAG: hypothetical protein COV31_02555 [Candidatus Yanofskybacteria bacterium CG10_big_fil_rev_8_21_14_0_10_46_23]
MFRRNKEKGFTLVELLVVIAIIGVLSTLLLLQLGTARAKARDAKRISDINNLRSAVELYFDDFGQYPPDPLTAADLVTNNYITQVPVDPLDGGAYEYVVDTSNSRRLGYHLYTEMEGRGNWSAGDSDINSSTGWDTTGVNAAAAGSEACANRDLSDNECIYDVGQTI